MTSTKTMHRLVDRLSALPGARRLQSYYVTSDDGEPDPGADYCREHADRLARALALGEGGTYWIAQAWSETDGAKRCEVCNHALHAGGLTKYGVDSALGLTETNPKRVHVYVAELLEAADSMMPSDSRWGMWEHHARRVLRNGWTT